VSSTPSARSSQKPSSGSGEKKVPPTVGNEDPRSIHREGPGDVQIGAGDRARLQQRGNGVGDHRIPKIEALSHLVAKRGRLEQLSPRFTYFFRHLLLLWGESPLLTTNLLACMKTIKFSRVNGSRRQMVNSRELAQVVAGSLGKPLTATTQHARNLRESKGAKNAPMLSAGGRGRHAPSMTYEDAAILICAVLGSEAVQDSVQTVETMRSLKAASQAEHFLGRAPLHRPPHFELGIEREHDMVESLARVLRFFAREKEYRWKLDSPGESIHEIYTVFEVEYPQHYASLTMGVRNLFWETWTFGRRSGSRNEQIRRARDYQFREIAEALNSVSVK
jgi:hypothetical protein